MLAMSTTPAYDMDNSTDIMMNFTTVMESTSMMEDMNDTMFSNMTTGLLLFQLFLFA